jgi:heme exporter protein D
MALCRCGRMAFDSRLALPSKAYRWLAIGAKNMVVLALNTLAAVRWKANAMRLVLGRRRRQTVGRVENKL